MNLALLEIACQVFQVEKIISVGPNPWGGSM